MNLNIVNNITLDFTVPKIQNIRCVENDKNSRTIHITVTKNGQIFALDNHTMIAKYKIHKPDNRYIYNSAAINSDGTVTLALTEQAMAAAGVAKSELQILDSSTEKVLSTMPFNIIIEKSVVSNQDIESTNEFDILNDLILHETERVESVKQLEKTVTENENSRNQNETIRKSSEVQRQADEVIRKSNEAERISNESNRNHTFLTLKAESQKATAEANNVDISSSADSESYVITITDRTGTSASSPNLLNKIDIGNVETGSYRDKASATLTGDFGAQKLNLRLPVGQPFKIEKSYPSVKSMNDDYNTTSVSLYQFVIIDTGNVEDEDNAKLYMKGNSSWTFITDLSGSQGIQGEQGQTGNTPHLSIGTVTTGEEGTEASAIITGTDDNPILNLVIPKGATGKAENISAGNIPYAGNTDTRTIKDIVDNKVTKEIGKGLSTNDFTTNLKENLDTAYRHSQAIGATAGTYKSVTVNEQGHVIAGTNPTTLAEYGITDAAAKTHEHTNFYDLFSPYFIYSEEAGDVITNVGRGGTRASAEPAFYGVIRVGTGDYGYTGCVIGLTKAAVTLTNLTSYGTNSINQLECGLWINRINTAGQWNYNGGIKVVKADGTTQTTSALLRNLSATINMTVSDISHSLQKDNKMLSTDEKGSVFGAVNELWNNTRKTDASAVTHTNYQTNGTYLPTMNFLSFWNGAYNSNNSSHLTYCKHGAFGTIVTKNSGDYLPASGGKMTNTLTIEKNVPAYSGGEYLLLKNTAFPNSNMRLGLDQEGANISFVSTNGTSYEIDTAGNNLRLYTQNGTKSVSFDKDLNVSFPGTVKSGGKVLCTEEKMNTVQKEAATAKSTADTALSTATTAKTTADTALSTAESVKTLLGGLIKIINASVTVNLPANGDVTADFSKYAQSGYYFIGGMVDWSGSGYGNITNSGWATYNSMGYRMRSSAEHKGYVVNARLVFVKNSVTAH